MRRRGLPIAWIGLIVVLVAFVVWYGWQTNVAPYLAEQRAQQQQQQAQQPAPAPSEEEIKAQLERNRAAMTAKPEPAPKPEPKPQAQPKVPQPDPKRDVMEYWWEKAPPKTKQ